MGGPSNRSIEENPMSLKRAMIAGLICASAALLPALAAQEAAPNAVPDLMAPGTGWTMINTNATDYVDPPTGPKPVTNDPKYPHIGNLQPGQKTDRISDLTNPILKVGNQEPMRRPTKP